ncbi:MAG: hypothetical protein M1812_001042 [Candelaria pacifica]|nr:MAG: hypothetical protein M1812_001042 [Candelaria pacifica]
MSRIQHSWIRLKRFTSLLWHSKPRPSTQEKVPCIEDLNLSTITPFQFLKLPAEIRNIIYNYALVMGTIDLWPQEVADVEDPNPVILRQEQPSFGSSIKPYPGWTRAVRQQDDLEYLRKHKAVSLLRCSRQLYNECHMIFWQNNTFQFSGRGSMVGLESFLKTIGAGNQKLIERLNVRYPANCIWEDRADRKVWLDQFSKHSPELRLVDVGHKEGDYLKHMKKVRQILSDSEKPKELQLILPNSFTTYDFYLDESYVADELKRLGKVAKLVFVVQRGAYCRLEKPERQAIEYNMDFIFEAACFVIERDRGYDSYQRLELKGTLDYSFPRTYDVPMQRLRVMN